MIGIPPQISWDQWDEGIIPGTQAEVFIFDVEMVKWRENSINNSFLFDNESVLIIPTKQ